jgi:hypothetical protein
MVKLAPALGNYAAPDRCWGRDQERRDIADYLRGGTSVLVSGPRRIGKTSIIHSVLVDLQPMRSLFIDVEHHEDPTEMFAALGAAASADEGALERIRGWFGKRLDRLDTVGVGSLKVELRAAMAGSWREDARAVVEALGDEPVVVAVDELPLLVDRVMKRDPAEAELLMGTLRALAAEYPQVRWVVSGSIGLEPVLHRAGLTGLITHLRTYVVDAWDGPTTTGAVEALAEAYGLDLLPSAAEVVHETLGLGVPYHVQLLMDEVRRNARKRSGKISADDVTRVYDSPGMASAVGAHLLHLESRLVKVLGEGDELRLARDLLTHAAITGVVTEADAKGVARDVIEDEEARAASVRTVLEILEHDAYLARHDDGWRFRSNLVRDWWRRDRS